MALLTIKDLCIGYDNDALIKNLNFKVDPGDYLCIVGENGTGKSTLMKTLLGLRSPMSGSIVMGDGLKANEIGYLPQQTQIQKDFPASVKEIVLSGCQGRAGLRPFYNKEEKQMAEDNMARLGISHLKDRCYRELSGGQQQRVAIARAVVAGPKLILADEPTGNLDSKNGKEVMDLLSELNQEGTTIVMVTHSQKDAARAQRTIDLFDGQIVSDVKNEL